MIEARAFLLWTGAQFGGSCYEVFADRIGRSGFHIGGAGGQDMDVDRAIRRAIAHIFMAPESAEVHELIPQLRSKDASLRLRAAKGLAKKGPMAESAVVDLLSLMLDPDADVRNAAVRAF